MPNDSAAPAASLAAFRAFLEAERSALVAELARESLERIPAYSALPFEEYVRATDEVIGVYIAALEDCEQMAAWAEQAMRTQVEQGADMAPLLASIEIYRQHLISVSLRAMAAGVEGAAEGLRALMRIADMAVQVILTLYQERTRLFQMLVENAPDAIGVSRLDGTQIYPNPAFRALLGYGDELVGMHYSQYLEEVDPEAMQQMAETGLWQGISNYRRKDGSSIACQSTTFIIQDTNGQPLAMGGFIRDISDRIRAEQDRITLQEQVIQAQQAALRELSTPLIPLADGIVAMPLVGTIDSRRAQQVVEELLQGVAGNRAATAIIDITGVPVVDTQVAGALVRAAQAVELLGARVILTGIRPEVAQTLVGIGVSLGSIVTRSTLRDGIAYALNER